MDSQDNSWNENFLTHKEDPPNHICFAGWPRLATAQRLSYSLHFVHWLRVHVHVYITRTHTARWGRFDKKCLVEPMLRGWNFTHGCKYSLFLVEVQKSSGQPQTWNRYSHQIHFRVEETWVHSVLAHHSGYILGFCLFSFPYLIIRLFFFFFQ